MSAKWFGRICNVTSHKSNRYVAMINFIKLFFSMLGIVLLFVWAPPQREGP
jgi:hypothetical protein